MVKLKLNNKESKIKTILLKSKNKKLMGRISKFKITYNKFKILLHYSNKVKRRFKSRNKKLIGRINKFKITHNKFKILLNCSNKVRRRTKKVNIRAFKSRS